MDSTADTRIPCFLLLRGEEAEPDVRTKGSAFKQAAVWKHSPKLLEPSTIPLTERGVQHFKLQVVSAPAALLSACC